VEGKGTLSKVVRWVVAPILVSHALERIAPTISLMEVSAILPYLAHFLKFAAYAGIGGLVLEGIIKEVLMPRWGDLVSVESAKLRDLLAETISQRGLLVRQWEPAVPSKDEIDKTLGEDPQLKKAKKALLVGDAPQAIAILEDLAARKPEHERDLLKALILSPTPTDWDRARSLLPRIGEPQQYSRLGYNYWVKRDLATAISLAETAHRLAVEEGAKRPKAQLASAKNTLAYYYADAEVVEKADEARHLADDAIRLRREEGQNEKDVGSALATLGYVKITFGLSKEIVEEGIRDCEDGRRMGARNDLYFVHVARAQLRLAKM